MLSFDTIHLLTSCLLDAEREAERDSADKACWSSAPTLLCLHRESTPGLDSRTEPSGHRFYSTAVPLPESPHLDTYHASLPAVLAATITAHQHAAAYWARARYTGPDAQVLAWALLYTDNTGGSGPIRVVHAADIDGRRYVLTRCQGESHAMVDVTDEPSPQALSTHGPLAAHGPLVALIDATTMPEPFDAPVTSSTTEGPDRSEADEPVNIRHADVEVVQDAALSRLLLDAWSTFHPGQRPPDWWRRHTVAAVTEHIQRITAQTADDLAAATQRAAHAHAALDNTRSRFRAQIIGAIVAGDLGMELGAGILEACGLERPRRRHYTVTVTVPLRIKVRAFNDDDALDAAFDHLKTALHLDERMDAVWTDNRLELPEAGEIDTGESDVNE